MILIFAKDYRTAQMVAHVSCPYEKWLYVQNVDNIRGYNLDTQIYVYDPPSFELTDNQFLALMETRRRGMRNITHIKEKELTGE